jgi:hypothetical protein
MRDADRPADEQSRRSFLKTATYVAPVILTLKAAPAFAKYGSGKGNNGIGNGVDPQPPGNPPINDGPDRAKPGRGN